MSKTSRNTVVKECSFQKNFKKNCLSDWDRFRTHPEKYPELYEKCGCCKDCIQLKGGHYCGVKPI